VITQLDLEGEGMGESSLDIDIGHKKGAGRKANLKGWKVLSFLGGLELTATF
jgi:hypothetical protein